MQGLFLGPIAMYHAVMLFAQSYSNYRLFVMYVMKVEVLVATTMNRAASSFDNGSLGLFSYAIFLAVFCKMLLDVCFS